MTIRVRNWAKFQHFKDRKPPWVKLHRGLLDDMEWHELDPEAAKALVMLWLIASEDEGALPDIKKLAFRLRLSEKQTNSIVSKLSHWLEHDDISPISDRYQSDRLETETETETETEERGRADALDPIKIAFDEYNLLAEQTGLPKANQLTDGRRKAIRARLAECGGIEGWRLALGKIRGSPFLTGQNDRSWRASLDFLTTASKFNKIMDGTYDGQPKQSEWADIGRAAAGDWDLADTPRLVGSA